MGQGPKLYSERNIQGQANGRSVLEIHRTKTHYRTPSPPSNERRQAAASKKYESESDSSLPLEAHMPACPLPFIPQIEIACVAIEV